METPSEWAKRYNRQKMDERLGAPNPEAAPVASPAPEAEFPSEPFQCPACGQLLAPTCRVCVACKHAIDPAELVRGQSVVVPAVPAAATGPKPQPARFSWPLFFVVFGVSCFLVIILQGLWKDQQQVLLIMGGIQTLAGVWVFFDAMRQRVPKPLRWSLGSMLLPLVIFPWYLARRRVPQSPVPFLEGGPVIRLVLFALLLFLLANLIFYLVQGSSPTYAPAPPSKEQKSGGSQVRINPFPPRNGSSWRRGPLDESLSLTVGGSVQAATSAPSDAWHT
jgi:hypothetical protein